MYCVHACVHVCTCMHNEHMHDCVCMCVCIEKRVSLYIIFSDGVLYTLYI